VIDGRKADHVTDEPEIEQAEAGGNRRALVLAAYARIAADGFEGLRTRDVAADVGVNIGTLHYYFPSKEALIRAVVRHTTAKFASTMPKGGTPAEQLRGHLEGIRLLLKTDQRQWAVLSEVALRAARDDALAEMMRESEDQWYGFLRGLVERGIAGGCLEPSLQAEGVAATIIAVIRGVCMPTMGLLRPERVDQSFDQLERWLGLAPATTTELRES
jgi:AcrR family transcriptional regulator